MTHKESELDREKKGRDHAIGIVAEKREMKRERVEDGS